MVTTRLFLLLAFALSNVVAAPLGASELIDSSTVGTKRSCSYAVGANGTETVTYLVGIGEACPTRRPLTRSPLRPPPSARLTKTAIVNGQRLCTYSQGAIDWEVPVTLNRPCPINAGMVRQSDQ